jgi:hypothetical protein
MIRFFLERSNVLSITLSCSLLLLCACATTARTENTIEERATARWNAVLSGDLAGAYEFLSPGFRSSVSATQYQRSILLNKVKWTGARYLESECTENTCKVKISLDYTLHGALPGVKSFDGTQTILESWVLSDGNWYLVPEK